MTDKDRERALLAEIDKYKERTRLACMLADRLQAWCKRFLGGMTPHDGQRVIVASEIDFFNNHVQGWLREAESDKRKADELAYQLAADQLAATAGQKATPRQESPSERQ